MNSPMLTDRPPNDPLQVRPRALRKAVRETYARAARQASAVDTERRTVSCVTPHSGLGCGSPTTFAGLAPGQRVLDLGCGAGFDCLAAAVEVGRSGYVVGIDVTPEMVRLAHRHVTDAAAPNVHVLLAEMELLPFSDASFDVVISNCAINLCADKARVLTEAWRVLKPNGRLAVADIVAVLPLPSALSTNLALHTGCIAGATPLADVGSMLRRAGFTAEKIDIDPALIEAWAPNMGLTEIVAAANIVAIKPAEVHQ